MKLMNDIFEPYQHEFLIVYLDDILIFSKNPADHLRHVQLVLDKLREHQLYAKLEKCEFFQHTVSFLGHKVSASGIGVDPSKTTAVSNYPVPTTVKQLQSFLGSN